MVFVVFIVMAFCVMTTVPACAEDTNLVLNIRQNVVGGTNCMAVSTFAPLAYTNATADLWMSTMLTNTNGWFITPGSKVVSVVRTVSNNLAYVEINYNTKNSTGGKFFRIRMY